MLGIGAGEGRGALRRSAGKVTHRLRRNHVLQAKDVKTRARLDRMVDEELQRLQGGPIVRDIIVRPHSNAQIGAWELGDELRVQARIPHRGQVDEWYRLTEWSLTPAGNARLGLVQA